VRTRPPRPPRPRGAGLRPSHGGAERVMVLIASTFPYLTRQFWDSCGRRFVLVELEGPFVLVREFQSLLYLYESFKFLLYQAFKNALTRNPHGKLLAFLDVGNKKASKSAGFNSNSKKADVTP
jgi:hypothetical protein